MSPFTIIFFGPPGSGKGTQVKLLERFLKEHDPDRRQVSVSTGEHFRAIVNKETYSSKLMRATLERGDLQPEFIAIWLWSGIFIEELKGDEHIITDGFPRMPLEGKVFDTALTFYQRESPHILHLKLTEEQAIQRLNLRQTKEGRADDQSSARGLRFKLYNEKTLPTIEVLRENPRYHYHEVNGERTVEEIHHDILKILSLS